MRFLHVALLVTATLWSMETVEAQAPSGGVSERPLVHPLFSDHTVIQRGKKVSVWGWADPGTTVTVSMDGQSSTGTADDAGRWEASLGPFKAGGPHALRIDGPKTITINDVLVGDVWICSGQSNMEWSVRMSNNAEAEIAAADHPKIRLFTVPKRIAHSPQPSVDANWQVCSLDTIADFSAVGYYFGRELNRKLDVPIGLIHTSWGGTVAEAWTSGEALSTMNDFREVVADFRETVADHEEGGFDLAKRAAAWWKKNDAASRRGDWASGVFDDSDWKTMNIPSNWETANIGLNDFDGVIWFRRELELPDDWAGKDVVLNLGPIDDVDTTYVNGQQVGQMQVWNAPRSYRVAAMHLETGRNVISIRVLDHQGDGGIFGEAESLAAIQADDDQTSIPLAGKWRYKVGAAKSKLTPFPQPIGGNPNTVTVLYNGMLAPLLPYGIKGAIWYQGESNASRPYQYRRLLPTMIGDWRARFGQGDFPFFIVQLANFLKQQEQPVELGWAELREAQLLTAARDPNVGLAVTTDIGEANDIHPRNKQDVGKRLALSALKIAYKQTLVHSGPTIKDMAVEGSSLRVIFDNVGAGLVARGGKLKGFAVAEQDKKKFVWADAVIEGDSVVLSSDELLEPIVVRYNWANNPIGNLFNREGLPAVPFRTDVEQR